MLSLAPCQGTDHVHHRLTKPVQAKKAQRRRSLPRTHGKRSQRAIHSPNPVNLVCHPKQRKKKKKSDEKFFISPLGSEQGCDRLAFQQSRLLNQLVKHAAPANQFCRRVELGHRSAVQNNDAIRIQDSVDSMRYRDDGAIFEHATAQRALNERIRFDIHGRLRGRQRKISFPVPKRMVRILRNVPLLRPGQGYCSV